MNTTDLQQIREYLDEHLNEHFVSVEQHAKDVQRLENEIHDEDKRLIAIETQLKVILWVLMAVGGGVITTVIKLLFFS